MWQLMVLILFILEDGFSEITAIQYEDGSKVLILFILEDGFSVSLIHCNNIIVIAVLILFILEDGFSVHASPAERSEINCLNPFYSGRWFFRLEMLVNVASRLCLNPFYSGRWFFRLNNSAERFAEKMS